MTKLFVLCAFGLVPLSVPCRASIAMTSYQVGYLMKPPASVLPGAKTSNTFIYMFPEVTGLTLTSPLDIDINTPNVVYDQRKQITGAQIPAGTVVNSYYVHANVTSELIKFLDQFIIFSPEEQVLGVMVLTSTIEGSNTLLGAPGTTYDTTQTGIGLHLEPTGKDFIVLQPATTSEPGNTITFREFVTSASVTDFRIITTLIQSGPKQ